MNSSLPEVAAALLRERFGFDPEIVKLNVIGRAAKSRAEVEGLDEERYRSLLTTDPKEQEMLAESLIVPETWFLRDRRPFEFLAAWAGARRKSPRSPGPLRILSAGCSTGEEPYSLAMTLLDAGFPPGSFAIDAVDLSSASLLFARNAIYSRSSFRGVDEKIRERWFAARGEEMTLKPEASAAVRFTRANITGEEFPLAGPYDVIFCRNLMIYLDAAAREKVCRRLTGLLAEDGILAAGASETGLVWSPFFEPVGEAGSFIFRKAVARREEFLERPAVNKAGETSRPASRQPSKATPRSTPRSSETSESFFARARGLADSGHLPDAARLCDEALAVRPDSIEGLHLRGVLHQALGDDEAAQRCFSRVLYLDPGHHDALIALSLLREKEGDSATAALLKTRAARTHATGQASAAEVNR